MTDVRSLSDFAGRWLITRRIVPSQGPRAHFHGSALWHPEKGGLGYVEQGFMTLDGQPAMQAERRYFWADGLRVFFADGRFFHQVPAQGGRAEHWCDPDTYVGRYDFSAWPGFTVVWQVSGPRKDYRSHTEYTRC